VRIFLAFFGIRIGSGEGEVMDESQSSIRRLQKDRVVYLGNGINHNMLDGIRIRMEELAERSREDIALIINSDGGDIPCTHRFCDQMKLMVDVPITGVVVGICWSAAVSILQTCSYRYAFPHADFFLHYSSDSFRYSLGLSEADIRGKFERALVEAKYHQAISEEIIAGRTDKTVEQVRNAMRDGDILAKHFSSREADEFGLIDRIVADPELWEK
jgi:ATP-dependent protease ClpP protease subunit